MTKIQIRKVNGVPMGREITDKGVMWGTFSGEYLEDYKDAAYPAPGFEECEAEGVLQNQYNVRKRYWKDCDAEDTEYLKGEGYIIRKIWRIIPTPEKVEVKDKLQLYADISFVYTGSALHINNDEGLFIYLDKEEIIKVRDFLNGLVPSPPTH